MNSLKILHYILLEMYSHFIIIVMGLFAIHKSTIFSFLIMTLVSSEEGVSIVGLQTDIFFNFDSYTHILGVYIHAYDIYHISMFPNILAFGTKYVESLYFSFHSCTCSLKLIT